MSVFFTHQRQCATRLEQDRLNAKHLSNPVAGDVWKFFTSRHGQTPRPCSIEVIEVKGNQAKTVIYGVLEDTSSQRHRVTRCTVGTLLEFQKAVRSDNGLPSDVIPATPSQTFDREWLAMNEPYVGDDWRLADGSPLAKIAFVSATRVGIFGTKIGGEGKRYAKDSGYWISRKEFKSVVLSPDGVFKGRVTPAAREEDTEVITKNVQALLDVLYKVKDPTPELTSAIYDLKDLAERRILTKEDCVEVGMIFGVIMANRVLKPDEIPQILNFA